MQRYQFDTIELQSTVTPNHFAKSTKYMLNKKNIKKIITEDTC